MRRLLIMLLLAVALLPEPGAVHAQATADQLNKLSLEALTTPAPGGNPGSGSYRRPYRASSYRGGGRSYGHRRSYRHESRSGYHRSAGRRSYRSGRHGGGHHGRHASGRRSSARQPGGYRGDNAYVPSFYRPRHSR